MPVEQTGKFVVAWGQAIAAVTSHLNQEQWQQQPDYKEQEEVKHRQHTRSNSSS